MNSKERREKKQGQAVIGMDLGTWGTVVGVWVWVGGGYWRWVGAAVGAGP